MLFEIGAAIAYLLIAIRLLRRKEPGEAFDHFLLCVCAAGLFYVNGGVDEIGELMNQLPAVDTSAVVIAPV